MKIYLAGPMRGKPEYNFPRFREVTAMLRSRGHKVLDPVELDLAYGFNPVVEDWDDADVMNCIRRDVEAILQSEAVVVLEDWEMSTGATAETAVCRWAMKPVYTLVEFLAMTEGEAA